MNLQELIQKYIKTGYTDEDASAKVCQDLILTAISNSKYSQNITIKGGVVMHNLSKDKRRATRDLDLDFIKYFLEDSSIRNFIHELDKSIKDVNFGITDEIQYLILFLSCLFLRRKNMVPFTSIIFFSSFSIDIKK